MTTNPNGSKFALTRWTLVERTRGSSPEAKAAMRELCEAYYAPVVAFVRREGYSGDLARDMAHEFFARFLSADSIGGADRGCGRFRSYLLGAVKHFLMNQKREAASEKRGGGVAHIAIGSGMDTSSDTDVADSRAISPDAMFDREWALVIIHRALAALEAEYAAAGNGEQFATLAPWISPAGPSQSQSETAARLTMSEGALKVTIHRLRKRFRELVRADVAQTLDDPAELDSEMQHLITALARQSPSD
jgi:DNA-directed RNA polymerase specialized sigma24 family protein